MLLGGKTLGRNGSCTDIYILHSLLQKSTKLRVCVSVCAKETHTQQVVESSCHIDRRRYLFTRGTNDRSNERSIIYGAKLTVREQFMFASTTTVVEFFLKATLCTKQMQTVLKILLININITVQR